MITRQTILRALAVIIVTLFALTLNIDALHGAGPDDSNTVYIPFVSIPHITDGYPVIFVSRQITPMGSVYYQQANSMPGVGPYDRFRVAAPGKLILREPDGTLRTLIDGSNPTPANKNLIDVNAPDVSYDGKKIVFAGLRDGTYDNDILNNPGAWRIYTINVDGTNLEQVTTDADNRDLSQFGDLANQFKKFDDTDPAWLPDGRIVFSSTRWPAFGQYSGARTSNLHVVNPDGSDLHRITAERNGADRPMVDPITGKIVYFRWWRNHRHPVNSLATIPDTDNGGYIQKDGLTRRRADAVGSGNKNTKRNAWHAATINPDGTGLAMWATNSSTFSSGEDANLAYGGAFTDDGVLYANYFPMGNMTEAAGFGGIRRYERGPGPYTPIIGVTDGSGTLIRQNPPSIGVYVGPYAGEPEALPDGDRLVISWAANTNQDYGLYVVDSSDGGNREVLYDNPGTSELRAVLVRSRPKPPIIADSVHDTASLVPPTANGPYDIDGTFTFDALNVYFNAPVDTEIVSAPPVGSAGSIRFYIDHQRSSPGSFPNLDWPILLDELPINPDGSIRNPDTPANVPLFEQIRTATPDYSVPLTGRGFPMNGSNYVGGAAHVAGLNFGRPGDTQTCVGCHTGHTMIPVPDTPEEAQWTNLAPGAEVTASSANRYGSGDGAVDRRVKMGEVYDYWWSDPNQPAAGQWLELTFPVPITVRQVRLYNPRFEDPANLRVTGATVRLYGDTAATQAVASKTVNHGVSVSGTNVNFNDVRARVVRIEINGASGTFLNETVAGLAEVEVIARGEAVQH